MSNGNPERGAVFECQGDGFLPTEYAVGPWAADRLHGGPVLGLLTRAMEGVLGEADWQPARLTFDLYRPVPRSVLHVRTEVLRSSARVRLVVATLHSDATEVARATGLSLRGGAAREARSRFEPGPQPGGPEGLPTEALLRDDPRGSSMPRGFHSYVQTRWLPQRAGGPLGIWFRMPMALVAGEVTSDLQRAAALADFCNAVASISARAARVGSPPYINTDTTIYLNRQPHGEWICLLEAGADERDGVSVTQTALHDTQGCFGHGMQARVANG